MVLDKGQLGHLEQRLLEELARTRKALGLHSEMVRGGIGECLHSHHMADDGNAAFSQEQAALRASHEGRYLYRVGEALRRLRTTPEQFGLCQANGEPIAFERLDAVPHARYCITHKREIEELGEVATD